MENRITHIYMQHIYVCIFSESIQVLIMPGLLKPYRVGTQQRQRKVPHTVLYVKGPLLLPRMTTSEDKTPSV